MSDSRPESPVPAEEVPADEVEEDVEASSDEEEDGEEEGAAGSGEEGSDDEGGDADDDDDAAPAGATETKTLSREAKEYSAEELSGSLTDYINTQVLATKGDDRWSPAKGVFNKFTLSGTELAEHEAIEGDFEALISIQEYNPMNPYNKQKRGKKGSQKGKPDNSKAWVKKRSYTVKVASLEKVGVSNLITKMDGKAAVEAEGASGPAYYKASFEELPEPDSEDEGEEEEEADEDSKPKTRKRKHRPIVNAPLPEMGKVTIQIYKKTEGEEKNKSEKIIATHIRFNTATTSRNTGGVVGQMTLQNPEFDADAMSEEDDAPHRVLRPLFHSLFHLPVKANEKAKVSVGDITRALMFFTIPLAGTKSTGQTLRIVSHTYAPGSAYAHGAALAQYRTLAPSLAAQALTAPSKKGKSPYANGLEKLNDVEETLGGIEEDYVRQADSSISFKNLINNDGAPKKTKNALKVVLSKTNFQQLDTPARATIERANVSYYHYRRLQNEWLFLSKADKSKVKLIFNPQPAESLSRVSNQELMAEYAMRTSAMGLFSTNPYPQPPYYINPTAIMGRRTQSFGQEQERSRPWFNGNPSGSRRPQSGSRNRNGSRGRWAQNDM